MCALGSQLITISATAFDQCGHHIGSTPIMTLGCPEDNAAAPLSGKAHSTSQTACNNHFAPK